MKKVLKSSLSLFLAIAIIFGSAAVGLAEVDFSGLFTVRASAESDVKSGSCGTNLTWTLDYEGTLTISGTGDMKSYSSASSVPWHSYSNVKSVVVGTGVTSIADYAFYGCTNLSSVTISDGVTSIGNSAFRDCTSLTTITIPSSVTSIGEYSFYDCTSLTSVTIPNGITSIADYVFYNCKSLNSVTIPDSVTSIGKYAFCYCENLTSINIPENVTKIGRGAFAQSTSLKIVEIPDSVTQVGACAFSGCTSLTTLKIGKGVTTFTADLSMSSTITHLFVSECTSLTEIIVDEANQTFSSVDGVLFNKDKTTLIHYPSGKNNSKYVIPDGVSTVGAGAFAGCTTLETLVLSDNVGCVNAYAFYNASNLTTLEVGKGLRFINSKYQSNGTVYIDYFPFSNCEKLTTINVDADNPYYSSADGVLFNKDKTSIILYPQNKNASSYEIPRGVVIIDEYAFNSCDHLEDMSVPYTVTKIKETAFNKCTALESISFATSGVSVGSSAFYGCSNLKNVNILDTDAWLKNSFENEYSNPLVYGADLYCDDKLVTEVIVSDEVTGISDYAFSGYEKLTSVTILDGPTTIGSDAFSGCINLTSISIPNSVTSIEKDAFTNTGYYNDSANYEDGILYISDCLVDNKIYSGDSVVIKEGTRLIANSAFDNNSICSITIPDSVINIGEYAFSNCYGLTEITIPVDVKTIGKNAFSSCRNLEKIYWNAKCADDLNEYSSRIFESSGSAAEGLHLVFGNTVERIPANMFNFSSCYISKITISESIKNIGDSAFSGCDDIDELYISDIKAWCGITFEPNEYGSCSSNPFAGAANLYLNGELVTELVIPDGVTDISQYAFYRAGCISEVVISDTVVNIGKNAFASCSGLEKITVGENVESMGDKVFSDCNSLAEVCWNAKNVEDFGSNSDVFYRAGSNGDGIEIVFGDSVEHIPAYLLYVSRTANQPKVKNIVLGKNVKSIGIYALPSGFDTDSNEEWENGGLYQDTQLIKVDTSFTGDFTIREGTTYIAVGAFSGCNGITSVKIPESVTGIGVNAFSGCVNLRKVYITDLAAWCNINFENVYSAPLYYNNYSSNYYNYIYLNGEALVDVVIPDGVTQISDYAFKNCTTIESVIIPEGVKTIGARSFDNCEKLNSVSLPTTITKIGYAAFYGCAGVAVCIKDLSAWCRVSVSEDIFDFGYQNSFYLNGEKIYDLVIPSDVTSIGSYVFSRYDFKTVTLHDGITSIGEYAFFDCENLTSINIPDGLTSIENGTFNGCEKLVSITLPDSITSIGDAAFGGCTSLASIVIPDDVTYIGSGAFYRCLALTSIDIPDGVTSIGESAFSSCIGLDSIAIKGNVKSIGEGAFSGCDNLTSVTILDGVESIGEAAFYSCEKLNCISIPDSVTFIGYDAFYGTSYYEDDFNWENGVLYIDNHLIYTDDTVSREYDVRNGTVTIGEFAFGNSDGLTAITIPESVVSVGRRAFADCDNLEKVYWNVIGNDGVGFYNCFEDSGSAGLGIEVIFGDSVEKIPDCLFSDCYSLTKVSFGDSVKVIGEDAFANCDSLNRVYYKASHDNWKGIDIGEGNDYLINAVRVHVCTCDDWVIDVEPTCTESGSRRGSCSACGNTITEEIPATGHISSNWIVDKNATCTEAGSKHGVCDVCGVVATAEIPATEHVYVRDEYVAPTCTATGLTSGSHCSACNTVFVAQDVIPANGHTIVIDNAINPTCTESGLTEGSHCSVCGEVIIAQTIIPAKGHTSSNWIIDANATVSAPGSKHKECTACGEVLETVAIPQLKPATPKVATENALTGVLVKWNAVTGATKYQVYRRQGGSNTWTLVGTTTGTSLTDTKVSSGIYYVYSVRAYNNAGQYSNFVSANTQTRKYMAVPKLKGISNTTNGLYITWNPVAGVTNGYRVYRRGAGSTYWTYLGTTKNTYFTDTQVKNNSGEYFRYTVIADGGYHSKFDTTGLYLRRLSNPTLKSAVSSKTGITVKWTPVKGCLGYYVYRKTANSGWQRIAVVNGANASSYVDKTAKKGVTYTYTVRAVCGNVTSYFNSGISCKDRY